MKIRALNESDSSNSVSDESNSEDGQQLTLSKEALESECFDKYKRALLSIQEFKRDEAKKLLEDLEEELEDVETDNSTLVQLRFSVLKNLGALDSSQVQHYVEALKIDPSDISLWIKTGDRATSLGNFSLARHCYEQALTLNSDNWVAMDRLMEIYYIIHLPFELYDVCSKALVVNPRHKKARAMIELARRLQPSLDNNSSNIPRLNDTQISALLSSLDEVKRKRRSHIQNELGKFKKARLGITLDTARTQSLASFGNYIIKIYERFAKQGTTRNTVINITLNNSLSSSQQITNGSVNSQSNNNTEPQMSCSQDIEMSIEADGASVSDNDKSDQRNDPTTSNDEVDSSKNNSKSRPTQPNVMKNSSLSFAAMLFPMDLGDKRRSSRNRSNQDDTFSFKMKFDELNELLPECLRIGAIERVLQLRREEQMKNNVEDEKEQLEESLSVESNLDPVREDLIIKDVIEAISERMKSSLQHTNDMKLCDLFYIYLTKLSTRKQNTLPDAFAKVYKFYRRICPLPTDVFVGIGTDSLTLDEIWFTLTANEIVFQHSECMFLLRILEQLRMHLDDTQHREFLVRLCLVLGLNSDFRHLDVALSNIEEDTRVYASNRKIITRAHVKTLIDRTNEKLQCANEDCDNWLDIINRLAPKSESEMSDREITSLCTAIKSAELWQRGLDILNQRNDLNSDIIMETINTCLINGAKMDAILASKLCKDAISGARPISWTCLYRGWVGVVSEQELESDGTIRKIDKFFELGHQMLGKKGTCTCDKGEFLMLYVNHLLGERDNFEERELLGATNCLFGYPTKKPSSVAGHKSPRVPIIWEYSESIYNYLVPEELPTYMSLLRKVGLTSEIEPIFRDIAAAVPARLDPEKGVGVIEDFINLGKPLSAIDVDSDDVTKDIFFFLADYYFKNKDFNTAKKFYHYDLVVNPDRFDSWAASGLIRANGIDKNLSEGSVSIEDFVDGPFRKLSDSAIRCFERATQLRPDEPKATLWTEFGNMTYNLSSLASRLYAYSEFEAYIEGKEINDPSQLENRHKYLSELAKSCFLSAHALCHSEEVWLQYYMLGKIHEKKDAFKALDYYSKADTQLYIEGATYPSKISYHNPTELAYEAMEVHYRLHSSALKYLLSSQDLTQETMNRVKWYLLNAHRSPFVLLEDFDAVWPVPPVDLWNGMIERDAEVLVDDLVESIYKDAEFDELIFMCLHGMKRCLVRCDKNFKALYRLADYYYRIRDSKMAQDILVIKELDTDQRIRNLLLRKPGVPDYRAAPPDLKGVDSLFKDRKMGNLFFNIWRIPVEEVDRPGSFEHWMFKCTWLLIKTCIDLRDTSILSLIAFQLSKQPETSKRYLHDKARVLLALFAVNSITNIITDAIDKAETLESRLSYIREGLALADRFIKGNVFADKMRDLFNRLQTQLPSVQPQMAYSQIHG